MKNDSSVAISSSLLLLTPPSLWDLHWMDGRAHSEGDYKEEEKKKKKKKKKKSPFKKEKMPSTPH